MLKQNWLEKCNQTGLLHIFTGATKICGDVKEIYYRDHRLSRRIRVPLLLRERQIERTLHTISKVKETKILFSRKKSKCFVINYLFFWQFKTENNKKYDFFVLDRIISKKISLNYWLRFYYQTCGIQIDQKWRHAFNGRSKQFWANSRHVSLR